MQVSHLAVIGLLAGTAHAGTVSSVTFDGTAPTEIARANGVEVQLTGAVVVYQHGMWAMPASADGPAHAKGRRDVAEDSATTPSCITRPAVSHRGLAAATVAGRLAYWPLVRDAECRYALPAGPLDALIMQESKYRPTEVSSAGAGGLTQLMPGTADELGVVDRFDPAANIEGGARYLRSMIDRYQSVPLALVTYNAGRGAVDRWRGIPLNRETPGYVQKVLGYFKDVTPTSPLISPALVSHAVSLSFGTSTVN